MDRLSGLTVLCFAGTYGLALASELARFVVRAPARWYLTVGLTALAWSVQTAYLGGRAVNERELPIASGFESMLVLSWILGAIALYLILRSPRTSAVGLFILPLVVAVSALAGFSGKSSASWANWERWVSTWGLVHATLLMLGAVFTCVAFLAGLMYLAQARRLKEKRPPGVGGRFRLPSLESSERLNRWAIIVAFPLLSGGFLIGLILVAATRRTGAAPIGWTDPKVLSALGLWLVFALLIHALVRPSMRGRRVMLLTVAAFGFLVFTWVGVDLLLPTAHGVPPVAGRAP